MINVISVVVMSEYLGFHIAIYTGGEDVSRLITAYMY